MKIVQVIAVILAVFLHHGNGRAITSTSSGNIERMLGLVEKELNTALTEANQKPTEREENPADLLRLVEPDLSSQGALQSFSDDVSDESALPPTEDTIIWRHKRSVDSEPACYSNQTNLITLASGTVMTSPICRQYPPSYSAACSSSINSQNNNQRKCKPNYKAFLIKGDSTLSLITTSCSCA